MPLKVPHLIHLVWSNSSMPARNEQYIRSWVTTHPTWRLKLWTDEEALNLVSTRYPDLLKIYTKYPADIFRADAIRYMILHSYGGKSRMCG